jgi:hypothetical protein
VGNANWKCWCFDRYNHTVVINTVGAPSENAVEQFAVASEDVLR